jgi:hypothetical protein
VAGWPKWGEDLIIVGLCFICVSRIQPLTIRDKLKH